MYALACHIFAISYLEKELTIPPWFLIPMAKLLFLRNTLLIFGIIYLCFCPFSCASPIRVLQQPKRVQLPWSHSLSTFVHPFLYNCCHIRKGFQLSENILIN